MRLRRLSLFLIVGLAGPAAAHAQDYDDPVAAKALDELVATLLPAGSPAREEPAAWVEVSRLLPTACDQLRWLRAAVAARAAVPATQSWAARLAQAALERGRALAAAGHAAGCTDVLPALERLAQTSTSPDALLDPQALRQRLDASAGLGDLTPLAKFTLLARGASPAKLPAAGTPEAWDTPRVVLDALAKTAALPAFMDLRRLQRRLTDAHADWTQRQKQPFADAGAQALVTATFQIAAACMDRALGLDAGDVQRVSLPIPYPLDGAEWAALAEPLKQANLWSWAALAAAFAGQPSDAQAMWAGARTVNADLWPAVGDAENGWLTRAANPARATEPGRLPLSADFRAAAHRERARLQEDLLKQFEAADASDEAAADSIFQTIQRAKAVELGLADEPKPLDLPTLKDRFGGDEKNHVYLFVEFLTLRQANGGAGRCGGVALYRPLYQERKKGDEATYADEYRVKILKPAAGPVELVTSALDDPGPPRARKDARIIIAPDGPPSPGWFVFEHQTLVKLTGPDAESWVVYLPSALALTSVWTGEVTLRAWHRSGLQSDPAADEKMATDTNPLTLGKVAAGLSSQSGGGALFTQNVWFQSSAERPKENSLLALMKAKREKQLDVLPVWVRK